MCLYRVIFVYVRVRCEVCVMRRVAVFLSRIVYFGAIIVVVVGVACWLTHTTAKRVTMTERS